MNRFCLGALTAAALCLLEIVPAVAQSSSTPQFIDQKFLSKPYDNAGCGPVSQMGDFNGDGRLDTSSPVCFQDANGNFSKSPKQPVFPELDSLNFYLPTLNIADMNGDGIDDFVYIATPTYAPNGVVGPSIIFEYLSNGDGTVKPAITYDIAQPFGYTPGGVVTADLDGNGTIDLAISGPNGLRVFLNDGQGHLRAVVNPASNLTGTLAAGDLNGDGKMDLILVSPGFLACKSPTIYSWGVQIYLGKGDGTFVAGASYLVNPYGSALEGTEIPPSAPVVADFNHDGHLDFASLISGELFVFVGNGHGAFKQSARKVMTFTSPGRATAPNNPTAAVNPFSLFTADFDRDGNPDLIVGAYTTGPGPTTITAIYSGKGDGTFGNPRVYSTGSNAINVGDFNHDGNPDVLSQDTQTAMVLYAGDGKGNLHAAAGSLIPGATSIVSADFNGDHIPDIAVVSKAYLSPYFSCTACLASVTILLGTGKGYFTLGKTYTVGLIDGNIAAGDINGDGKADLVVTRVQRQNESSSNPPATDTSVLIGNGDGTFSESDMTLLGGAYGFDYNLNTYLVDVNHDGKLDLVGDWGVALGDGTGSFHPPTPFPMNANFIVSIAIGDFNRDGNVDVAVTTSEVDLSMGGAAIYTLIGDGKGNFTVSHQEQHPIGSAFDAIGSVAVADINRDGKPDLLFTSTSYEKVCCTKLEVELGKGNGQFAPAVGYTIPTANASIVLADFNRDGALDVALAGPLFQFTFDVSETVLLLGKGDGTFNPSYQTYTTPMYSALAVDVNGDGVPDLIGTNTLTVTRLLNSRSRQASSAK